MQSFSASVKQELLNNFKKKEEDRYILLGLALLSNGRMRGNSLRFSTGHQDLATLMATCLDEEIGLPVSLRQGKELTTLNIEGRKSIALLKRFWQEDFDFDGMKGRLADAWVNPTADAVGAGEGENGSKEQITSLGLDEPVVAGDSPLYIKTLQSVFLAGGSLAEPSRFYQLEMTIRRRPLAEQLMALLLSLNFPVSLIKRSDYYVLYMKDANGIGDFLALTGAHLARLEFGNCRLKRDLRNHVNRLVNCDSANSRRLADASARQLHSLTLLKDSPEWEKLPGNLRQTAELRLAYPDLSLRELGELSDPPLAKSGVNHRLKRLLEISATKKAPQQEEKM